MQFTIYYNKTFLWFKFTYRQKIAISANQYTSRVHYRFQYI